MKEKKDIQRKRKRHSEKGKIILRKRRVILREKKDSKEKTF